MKTLRLVSTPTRNRRLNEILGMVILVGAGLLLLALVSYTPTDPSFNTVGQYVTGRPAHNWTGMVGAYLADGTLQLIGVAAFFLPLVLARLGVCWMRSRPAGSPLAKTIGLGMWVVFAPAAIALLPGTMLWRSSLPIEGTTGRLLADFTGAVPESARCSDCAGTDGGGVAVSGNYVYVQYGTGVGDDSLWFPAAAVGLVVTATQQTRRGGSGDRRVVWE